MGAVDASIDPPPVYTIEALGDRLDAANAGTVTPREAASGQLIATLQYLASTFGRATVEPLVALLNELTELDEGTAGQITAPTVDQKASARRAWTRAVMLAIVQAGMDAGSEMAPILARILSGSGIDVLPTDIANWRTLRDNTRSARKCGEVRGERAFDLDEYDAAVARLAADPTAESDQLSKLSLIAAKPERRRPRKIKDGGR